MCFCVLFQAFLFNNVRNVELSIQQLYLAGNQITSLVSLPQLPNLEFLSVAQNRLKSLSMASQPQLQVLAASKNKISTLKGFPHLPVLEHLRVEENPILEMPHLEAASILLIGPTLKKFNDRDLSREELEIAKCHPAHTALCIRDGWDFCRPDLVVGLGMLVLLDIVHSYSATDEMVGLSLFDGSNDCYFHTGNPAAAGAGLGSCSRSPPSTPRSYECSANDWSHLLVLKLYNLYGIRQEGEGS